MNSGKVQKQLKYYKKLYLVALQDYVNQKVRSVQDDSQMEMSVLKKYIKDLEGGLQRERSKLT